MNLFLQRHATAEAHDDETLDVPLLPLGKAEARLMGRWLRSTGYRIDVVLCSDLKRSHGTARRMANRVDAPLVVVAELGPSGDPETAWKAILKAAADRDHVLVVTHGPLIQNMRDWLVGNPGTSWQDQHWVYGCIHHLKDGREHWAVAPHMIARTMGEEGKLRESTTQFLENLKRATKAHIVDPLITNLAAATRKRFKQQSGVVIRAIKRQLRESDATSARRAAATALAAYSSAQWLATYKRATQAAYKGGVGIAAGQLSAAEPSLEDLGGPERTAELAASQIDNTTTDRVLKAILDDDDRASILEAVGGIFHDRAGDADGIGLTEVSSAFHDGMVDAAESISGDTGDDVEKHWDAEDDACEDCQDCDDEGWVDIDFTYPAFGVDEPEGHPNCRCSLELRRASET